MNRSDPHGTTPGLGARPHAAAVNPLALALALEQAHAHALALAPAREPRLRGAPTTLQTLAACCLGCCLALAHADPMRPLTPAPAPAGTAVAAAASQATGAAAGSSEAAPPWLLAIRQDPLGQRSALINMPAAAPGAAALPRWLREGDRLMTADGEALVIAIRPLGVELQVGQLRLTQQLLAPLLLSTDARPADAASAVGGGTARLRSARSTGARAP